MSSGNLSPQGTVLLPAAPGSRATGAPAGDAAAAREPAASRPEGPPSDRAAGPASGGPASDPNAETMVGAPAVGSGPVSAPAEGLDDQPLVAGKYRLVRLIGQGGMGAVYEARHEELGKRVAVKLVDARVGQPQEIIDRFRREARATVAIDSEHIVQVFDAGHDPARGLYMAMEYLRGCDLATALTRVGRLEVDAACALVAQVAVGLGAAHEAGIVHRDLKPANIFLVPRSDGSLLVKLVDFGIAKVLDETHPSHAMSMGTTRQGAVVGTPQYMSPEQAQGLRDVDARSDMYSLGAVFHEILTGSSMVPLLATYEMTILHIMTKPVPALRTLCPAAPEALAALVGRMVALEPERRPADMEQVIAALLELRPGLASAPLRIDGLAFDSVSRVPRSFSHPALGQRPAGAPRSTSPSQGDVGAPASDEPLVLPMRPASRGTLAAGLGAVVALVALGGWALQKPPAPAPPAAAAAASLPAPPAASAVSLPTVELAPARPSATAPAAATSARSPAVGKAAPRPTGPAATEPAAPAGERKIGGAGLAEKF